ncbi:aminopeptidase P family protein [Siminovitchia sp. FSL W7-1587]|uniref:M24 family metallopeptidase n=1 Tax=Siminovitchia sp. FSL W7-1587 TaxID=2954699 RepID=UPI0030CC6289
MFHKRKAAALAYMKEFDMELLVLVPGSNLYYMTGNKLKQSERLTLYFLERSGRGIFFVPEVEKTKFMLGEDDCILSYSDDEGPQSLLDDVRSSLAQHYSRVGVETNTMRLFEYQFLHELGMRQTVHAMNLLKEMRQYKNSEEIKSIKKAVSVLEESLLAILPTIQIGVQEKEIAAKLEYEMRMRGSEGTPFSTIVASGYRGALPHGRASDKTIEDGDFIVIDFGAIVDGYVGDMTRTIGIGHISAKQKEVYHVVKRALTEAIASIKIDEKIGDIDATARNIISQAGYGDYFTHRLGHGIGLDAHEDPYIMQTNDDQIRPGMAFTIEPGIYLQNEFGVRIEDNIVVTEAGIENVMTVSHDLIVL